MRATTVAVMLLVAGCKGSHGGAADAGPPDAAGLPRPTAAASCTSDYVGLRTICDASASSDPRGRSLGFTWSVTGPAGSKVSATGNGPSFEFVADRGGAYPVTLIATTVDGASDSITVVPLVPTVPLFYRQAALGPSSDSFALGVVQSDGSGARPVSCAITVTDPSGNGDAGAANRSSYGDTPGLFGTRVQYGSGATRVVFEQVTPTEHQLLLSDDNGDCTARPPLRLDATPAPQHLVPRFSPDGVRIAWIDVGSPSQLVTAQVDGSARRVVRTAAKLKTAPPQWLNSRTLAWVEDVSADSTPHLQIASALDDAGAGDGAARATLVDCPAATDPSAMQVINQFAVLAGVYVLSGGVRSRTANPPGATNLYRLAGASCSATAATTLASEPAGGFAWDFAVAPDDSTIVLAAQEPGGSAHDLYLVPVDGSVAPSRFVGSAPGLDDIGPTFIAAGKQLTWTQIATDGSASGGGIMVANRDGTQVRSVLAEGGSTTAAVFVGGPTNRGLDCSVAGAGAAFGDALLLLAALQLVRRRRRP